MNDEQTAQYRQLLEQCESQASSDFDKTAVTLAGGALGVSLAFLKDIAPDPLKWSVYWLLAPAWTFLVLSLLSIFLSLMTSMESMRHELQCLNGIKKKPQGEGAGGKFRKATYWCNYAALTTCVLGIASLAAFAVINTGSKAAMSKPQSPQSSSSQSGEDNRGRVTPDQPAASQTKSPSGLKDLGRITPDRAISAVDSTPPTGAGRVTPDRPENPPSNVAPPPANDKK